MSLSVIRLFHEEYAKLTRLSLLLLSLKRKLRITVNTDPTVSSKDRENAICFEDFVRPFPNLAHLEIDYTVLEDDDARIKEKLAEIPGPEDLEPSDLLNDQTFEAATVVSLHFKLSSVHQKMTLNDTPRGLGYEAVDQFNLAMQQVAVPNLRHLHITWDYDSFWYSFGNVLRAFLHNVGLHRWRHLETMTFCLYMVSGDLGGESPPPVVSTPCLTPNAVLTSLSLQEMLLHDLVLAFDNRRWHQSNIVVFLYVRDRLEPVPPEAAVEDVVERALYECSYPLPEAEPGFSMKAEEERFVPRDLKLQWTVYGESAYFERFVPLARFTHTSATHQVKVFDPYFWRRHFEYIEVTPEVSSLIEGTQRCLSNLRCDLLDVVDHDFVPDSDDASSDSDSESGISDSFRRSPTPF